MPRQNGKGDEVEVVELWGLVQRAERILHTIHDAVLLATEAQSRLLSVIEGHADLRRLKERAWRGTGQQMIEMRNGGIIWYRTRTGGGARGVDEVDRIVADEAQHAEEEHIAAISPTMLASANPQLNALGSAGIANKSGWWWRLRRRALSADPGDFGYVGHTAERVRLGDDGRVVREPVNARDRKLWACSNPALVRRPDLSAFLEEQLSRLGDELFAREHLGVWDAEEGDEERLVKLPADRWADTGLKKAAARARTARLVKGEVTLAFAVSIDYSWSSIAVGAGSLADPYVEVFEHKQGVGWLPQRLVELVQTWEPLAWGCDSGGPTGSQVGAVLSAFAAEKVSTESFRPLSMQDYKHACGGFFTDVVEGRLKRPADGQGPLDLAAADATERTLGDAWAWDRRNVRVPISPLEAVTVARSLLPVGSAVFAGGFSDLDDWLDEE